MDKYYSIDDCNLSDGFPLKSGDKMVVFSSILTVTEIDQIRAGTYCPFGFWRRTWQDFKEAFSFLFYQRKDTIWYRLAEDKDSPPDSACTSLWNYFVIDEIDEARNR